MDLKALAPKPTERMMIVGRTGSGKTTLARFLLATTPYPRILVIDSKCTYGGKSGEPEYEIVRTPRELQRIPKRYDRIQYRPHPVHQHVSDYEAVYEWAYRQGKILVYSDELYLTMAGTHAPDWQRACITCGRELEVGMISATQRPRGIDPRVRTESEVKAQFELEEGDDVIAFWGRMRGKRMLDAQEAVPMPRHSFYFRRVDGGLEPRLYRLNLKGTK